MKKHFLVLLGIFIFILIPNNAYAISMPTHICSGNNCDNNPTNYNWWNGSVPVWSSTNSYYSYYGSTDPLPTFLGYYWGNANFCNNQAMTIEGYLFGNVSFVEQLDFSMVMDVTINNSTTRYPCAISRVNGGASFQFSCSAVNGGGSVNLTFVYEQFPIGATHLGIYQNTTVTCNPTNASVINNQIQNTQNIINNQNQNTQTLANSILNTTNAVRDVITDAEQNTRYLLNAQNQTNQAINDTNNTMKDDNIDSSFQNSSIDSMNSQLASNNVISDLLLLPVSMYQKILSSVNGSCSAFNLGSLYGTNLVMPCIQPQNYIGSTLWGVIDILFCGFFILVIRKKFVDIFNNMTNLKNGGNEIE